MTNYPSQPILEAARRDPSAKTLLLMLCNYHNHVTSEVASGVAQALPLPDSELYELARDAMLLAENQWVDLKRRLRKQPNGKKLLKPLAIRDVPGAVICMWKFRR